MSRIRPRTEHCMLWLSAHGSSQLYSARLSCLFMLPCTFSFDSCLVSSHVLSLVISQVHDTYFHLLSVCPRISLHSGSHTCDTKPCYSALLIMVTTAFLVIWSMLLSFAQLTFFFCTSPDFCLYSDVIMFWIFSPV